MIDIYHESFESRTIRSLGYTPYLYHPVPGKNRYFSGYGDYASCGNVQYGQTGDCVSEVQAWLAENGYNITADGIFGQNTLTAVMNFQSTRGLTVDGIVGTNTWDALINKKPPVVTPTPILTPTLTPTPTPTPIPTPTPVIPPIKSAPKNFLQQYLPYILIGGGAILIVYFLTMPKYIPAAISKIMPIPQRQ